jgi:putative transposase
MRNALAYAGKTQRRIVSAWVGTAFAQDDAAAARKQWREVADQARPRVPKLAALMDDAETDMLAYMGFPAQHRAKLHSTDEIDKLFRRDLLSWVGTGDRAAKSRAGGCKPDHAAFSVLPRLRHPCAALTPRLPLSDEPLVGLALHAGRARSHDHAALL